jgi:hypothetical protein
MTIFTGTNSRWAEQSIDSRRDYSEDWSELLSGNDSILSSAWSNDGGESLVLDGDSVTGSVTSVWISGGVAGKTYRISNIVTTNQGRRDARYFSVTISDAMLLDKPINSALFSRFSSVKQFKNESLAFLDKSFPVDNLTDDYIWDSLLSAEADASRQLRTFFEPTVVIPDDAPADEVARLAASGTKFVQEAAYDYEPNAWNGDGWGYMILRKTPVVSIESVIFAYPKSTSQILNVNPDWIRLDHKYGHVRFVPSGPMMAYGPVSFFMMSAISAGRHIPGMISVRYVSGLKNAAQDYPDLLTVVKRMAILRILKNAFLPQSSSISADGLSQSTSVDVGKWEESIEQSLEVLRQSIHGVRFGVF